MKKVFVAGSLGLDIIPLFAESAGGNLFAQGKYNDMQGTIMYLGGCVGNTGLALAKLGIPTTLYSKVGDDDIGSFIINLLNREKVRVTFDVVKKINSTSTVVISPPGVDRILLHSRGASQTIVAEDLSKEELSKNDLFHFGYPTAMRTLYTDEGSRLVSLMMKAHELGLTTSLDTSQPDPNSEPGRVNWFKILSKVLPFVDIFLPSLEELLFMLRKDLFLTLNEKRGNMDMIDFIDMSILPDLAEEVLSMGPSIVVIKIGKKGAYLRSAGMEKILKMGKAVPSNIDNWANREIIRQPYVPSKICSTTGAGDTMIAGFLAGLVADFSVEDTLAIAEANAIRCIESFKTTDRIMDIEKLYQYCTSNPPMINDSLDMNYWSYDLNSRNYIGKKDKQ